MYVPLVNVYVYKLYMHGLVNYFLLSCIKTPLRTTQDHYLAIFFAMNI